MDNVTDSTPSSKTLLRHLSGISIRFAELRVITNRCANIKYRYKTFLQKKSGL